MNRVTTSLGFRRHSAAWASPVTRLSVAASRMTDRRMRVSHVLLPFVGGTYKYRAPGGRLPWRSYPGARAPPVRRALPEAVHPGAQRPALRLAARSPAAANGHRRRTGPPHGPGTRPLADAGRPAPHGRGQSARLVGGWHLRERLRARE